MDLILEEQTATVVGSIRLVTKQQHMSAHTTCNLLVVSLMVHLNCNLSVFWDVLTLGEAEQRGVFVISCLG